MSLLKRLFGGGSTEATPAQTYQGYTITPTPIHEGGQFRISAKIERDIDGVTKSHTLIRADTLAGREAAEEASIEKAQQVIDSLGDGIFK